MVLLASFMALEVLGADLAGNVTAAVHFVLVVVHEGFEGELALRADGGLLLEDLLTTRGRHFGGG